MLNAVGKWYDGQQQNTALSQSLTIAHHICAGRKDEGNFSSRMDAWHGLFKCSYFSGGIIFPEKAHNISF